MNKMLRLFKTYLAIFFAFSFFHLLLFHSPLFSPVRVLFYRGTLLLLISFLCFISGYFLLRKKIALSEETFLAALVMSLSLHLAFFVVFPVTFERSITMFLLEKLSLEPIFSEELEEILVGDYVIGRSAVAKRVEEQKIIGFVDDRSEFIRITSKGRKFLDFAKMIKRIYGVK